MSADTITQLLIHYRYWIVIPLAFLEGPLVALNVGFLAYLGYFDPLIMFAIMLARDFAMDGLCYAVGHYGNKTRLIHAASAKIGITNEHWAAVEQLWRRHPGKTMFISKLAYGLSATFLISAGIIGITYKRFWYYAITVSVFQYAAFLLLGYYFGASSYALLSESLKSLEYISAAILVLSIAFYFLTRAMRHTLLTEERKEEQH